MCQRHTFGRICDQITGNQGIFHADMSHSDTITDCDRRKYNRCAASHRYTQLHGIYNLVQVHVSRNNLIIRTYDTDERFVHLLFRHTECIKQRTVRCLLHPFLTASLFIFSSPSISFDDLRPCDMGRVFTFIFDFIAFMELFAIFLFNSLTDSLTDQPAHLNGSNLLAAIRHDIHGTVALGQYLLYGILDGFCFLIQIEGISWSIIAAERIVAIGFAMSLPAMSGAEPWLGS